MLSIPAPKQREIAERWLAATIATYPGLTAEFVAHEKDPFRNPVGACLREGIVQLTRELCGEMEAGRIGQALEGILRIRAVQDFSPRQAVGFVFTLREILREEPATPGESAELESRLDAIALAAFDVFMKCREQVYEVRLHESRRAESVLGRTHTRGQGG